MQSYQEGVQAAERGEVFDSPNLRVFPVTDSTMNRAAEAITAGRPTSMTFIALAQEKGRGSGRRKWASGNGNLMFSRSLWVEKGECGQEMEMVAACAVAEVIKSLLLQNASKASVTVKYPNDVLIDGKKVCGCLVPPVYDAKKHTRRLINLGVGVNLKVAPKLNKPTTCLLEHGIDIGIAPFMEMFDAKFAEVMATYRVRRDFSDVLRRLRFLDAAGKITLRKNVTHKVAKGKYNGFRVTSKKAYMVIGESLCAVHAHKTVGAPLRQPIRYSVPHTGSHA